MIETSDQGKKYLVIGPAWVGDMVMAQSLFIDIKRREPGAVIDVLAPAWTAALVDRMPQIRQLVSANFTHGKLSFNERYKLGKRLRKNAYTHSICLPNSIKSALVPAIAKIPKRTGFIGEQRWWLVNDIRRLDKALLPMTVQRFVALGLKSNASPPLISTIPAPRLSVHDGAVSKVLSKYQLTLGKKVLALCPGAEFGASKQWPIKHYAQVAQYYLSKGWQVWLLGSEKDVETCQEINQKTDSLCRVLAGETSLPEVVDLLSCVNLAVSNDSGLMHIAAALRTTLIAVYGSTDPGHTPPLSDNHEIVKLDLECSPCFKRECPLGHLNCLRELSAELVIDRAERLLQ